MHYEGRYDNRTFNAYYHDVGKYELLTSARERELILRYKVCSKCNAEIPQRIRRQGCPECGEAPPPKLKNKLYTCSCGFTYDVYMTPIYCLTCGTDRDFAARDELITSNLRFVVKTARGFTRDHGKLLQLTSAGNVGLLIALDKFDIHANTRFLTYAAWWVRKEMLDEINASGLVHVPVGKQKEHRRKLKTKLYQCKHCDLQLEQPKQFAEYVSCTGGSHDFALITEDKPLHTVFSLDRIDAMTGDNVEQDVIDSNVASVLHNILNTINLKNRDKFIVLQYYNIPEPTRRTSSKSLHQLSEIVGITPERVRQVKERALQTIRVELKRRSIGSLGDLLPETCG